MLEWLLLGLLPLGMDQAQAGQDTYLGKKLEDWIESLTKADGPGSHEALEALCTFGKSAVPGLVKLLGDRKVESRIRAARTLSELGPEAVEALPALKAALERGGDERLIAETAQAIARMGSPGIPVLEASLASKDRNVRIDAAFALTCVSSVAGRVSKAAIPVILAAELDPRRTGRGLLPSPEGHESNDDLVLLEGYVWFILGLGGFGAEAVPQLLGALKDDRASIRKAACHGLAKVGPDAGQAAYALRETLKDGDPWLRLAAARALARIDPGDVEALQLLMEFLSGSNSRQRWEALQGLGGAGPSAAPALPSIVRVLNAEEKTDMKLRLELIRVLGEIGSAARADLERIEGEGKDAILRLAARHALGRITADDVPALVEALGHQDSPVRQWASKAFGHVGPDAIPALERAGKTKLWIDTWIIAALRETGPRSVPVLLEPSNHGNPAIRHHALSALGEVGRGDEAAIARLRAARRDPDRNCRGAARSGLRKALGAPY